MAKAKQKGLRDASEAQAIDLESVHNQVETQVQDAVLVTAENSARFKRDPAHVPSPVQSIQERLEMEFAAQIHEDDDSMRDLRPIGFAIAVVFSLIAWTLIIQVVRIGF
ncbi:MAG TPA: hypothetical protein DIU09_16775 [Hyphomonadaceae bacterium]|uniref:hypothetical protein n=1 Tax=Aquidulcibacter sp. TaxID=2052990 RepID=UPI00078BD2EC|nr:hypothetical protein [Aquidulcibacter sp.]AMS30274.1 hypothetical protein AEM38_13775 [Hyphomonadaceae bacterium UKL13-1]MCA3696492.1 hypothetical protein [Aquidulcibacter sp.]HCP66230.1 hypothetical protein [Hyphomonadaceae bacterium]